MLDWVSTAVAGSIFCLPPKRKSGSRTNQTSGPGWASARETTSTEKSTNQPTLSRFLFAARRQDCRAFHRVTTTSHGPPWGKDSRYVPFLARVIPSANTSRHDDIAIKKRRRRGRTGGAKGQVNKSLARHARACNIRKPNSDRSDARIMRRGAVCIMPTDLSRQQRVVLFDASNGMRTRLASY